MVQSSTHKIADRRNFIETMM